MIFMSLLAAMTTPASIHAPAESKQPTIIVDTRWDACDVEEQNYYFRGKAERRLAKLETKLQADKIDYRVVRWSSRADVPSPELISAMGPKKYLRNC